MISLGELERQLRSETPPASASTGFDILLPQHFVSIVRGKTEVRNFGARHGCSVELLTQSAPRLGGPAAVFGSRGFGWLDTLEVVLLNAGKRTLIWKRKGKQADIAINGKSAGRIELGWCLEHAHVGSGRVWVDGYPFCEIALPLRGPSISQTRDCTGRFTFVSDQKAIKFVISPKGSSSSKVRGQVVTVAAQSAPGAKSSSGTTIFSPSDEARLTHLSDEQRMILLALAIWPWALYKR